MTPKTDTRRLKRVTGDYFTVEPAGALFFEPALCDYCGRIDCALRDMIDANAIATVRACRLFIPVLGFSVTAGLDLPRWNTVRLGAAWPKRVRPGEHIAIVDTRAGRLIKHMAVERMVVASLGTILEEHAGQNHAVLGSKPENAVAHLRKILRGSYGTTYTRVDRMATALYLRDTDAS